MMTREEVIRILRDALPDLAEDYGVHGLALFGSYARGDQDESSDVDVIVEVDPSIGLRFVDLADHIEALLGMDVDVISRRAISPAHWEHIKKDLVNVA